VKQFSPEVCILDIQMPGESGYSLARNISEQHRFNRPVLIAISGKWTTQTDRLLARTVGFDHFLLKPADPTRLVGILDQIRGGGGQRA